MSHKQFRRYLVVNAISLVLHLYITWEVHWVVVLARVNWHISTEVWKQPQHCEQNIWTTGFKDCFEQLCHTVSPYNTHLFPCRSLFALPNLLETHKTPAAPLRVPSVYTFHSSSWSSSRGSSRGSSPSANHRLQTGPGLDTAGRKSCQQWPSSNLWLSLTAEGRLSEELGFLSVWHSEGSTCCTSAWTRARSSKALLTHKLLFVTEDHVHKEDTNQQAPNVRKSVVWLMALRKTLQAVCKTSPTLKWLISIFKITHLPKIIFANTYLLANSCQ